MPGMTILTHADCDGLCAGSIALSKFPQATVFFTKPVSLYRDLESVNSDRIVICDIALSHKYAQSVLREMGRKKDVVYIDHHPLPGNVTLEDVSAVSEYVHKENVSASELAYRKYKADIPEERVWNALWGAIGDYSDDTAFVKEVMLNWDKISLYFQVSTLMMGIKTDAFDSYDAKRLIVRNLAGGGSPSDMEPLVRAAREAVNRELDLYDVVKKIAKRSGNIGYVKEIQGFGFRGSSALFSATVTDAPIGICVTMRGNNIDVTIRSRNSKYKLNEIAEKAAEYVKGSGGGLPAAAGARIPKGTLDRFIKKMNSFV